MATSYAIRGAVEDRGASSFIRACPLPSDDVEVTIVENEPPTQRWTGSCRDDTPATVRSA